MRLYLLPERTSFDADQEEIAFKAKEILSGNPVLLGPKTSLGGFSIGPGFTYLWSFFSFFLKGDPLAGACLSVFLGVSFIIGVYLISEKIFSGKVAWALSLMLAVSINIISWDQIPWAPSLFYLSELLVFYGAYISDKKEYGLPLVALGLALGLQSHFAVFLILLPVLIYLIIFKPIINKKNIFISVLILFVSYLPILVYDLTHNFINFQRLTTIFSLSQSGNPPTTGKLFTTLVSNSVNIVWLNFPGMARYMLFLSAIGFSIWNIFKDDKFKRVMTLSILLLFIPFIIFLFYKSNFSEYYLMTAVVPFVFILGRVFWSIKSKFLLLLILSVLTFVNVRNVIYSYKPMNLSAKKQIVHKIVEMGGKDGYGVSLSTAPGYSFGYSYIFDYYGAAPNIPPQEGQEKIFTIIAPSGYAGIEPMFGVDGLGLRWEGMGS